MARTEIDRPPTDGVGGWFDDRHPAAAASVFE